MTAIDGLTLRGKVDMVVGGTPCQAFSIAGKRMGLEDERGNLSLIFTRLVNDIDPDFIIWENVSGVLSSKDNAFGCFLAGLVGEEHPLLPPGGKWSNAGCVYGPVRTAVWRVLDAQYFGLAQRRRRVFVIACPHGRGSDPSKILFEWEGQHGDTAPCRGKQKTTTFSSEKSSGILFTKQRIGEYIQCGVSSTIAARDYKSPTDLVVYPDTLSVRRLTPVESERLQGFPDDYTNIPYRGKQASDNVRFKAVGNSMAVNVMRWIGERIQKKEEEE
jgi:site-specific DNA-cytosine methylase